MTNFNLKIIALITMFIDHIGGVFFPQYMIFRYIGRISFPIYAFLISEGLKKTSNIKKYIFNLLLLAIISEPFYDLCFYDSFTPFSKTNTLYTLFISSLFIYFYKNTKYFILKYTYLFTGLIISYILYTDYSYLGVMLIYTFYFIKNKKYVLMYGIVWCSIKYIYTLNNLIFYIFNNIKLDKYIFQNLSLYIYTIIPFFIILFYNGKRGKNAKYTFYILYPLHLFVIYILKFLIFF